MPQPEEKYGKDSDGELFRLLVENVTDYAIFLLDPHGHVASWNLGAERIKGYRADEIIGQHFSRFYRVEDIRAGKPDRELRMAAAEGRSEDEGWRVRKDGTQFWASVVTTALLDDAGTLKGFSKIARDLTERRRSEEQIRIVVESSPTVMVTRDGTICLANIHSGESFGYCPGELIGRPIEVLVPDRFRQRHLIDRATFSAAPHRRRMGRGGELFGRRNEGGEFPVEIGLQPITTAEGNIVLASIIDITERKQAEAALRASEELARSILNAISAHIAVLDGQGSIVSVNSAWERFAVAHSHAGLDRSGVGVNYLDVCREAVGQEGEKAECILDGLKRVLDGSLPEFSAEYPCHSPTESRWFLLHATPLSGGRRGAVVAHTSITELKRAEQSLRQAHDELEDKVRERTAQLTGLNEELGREVEDRRTAEAKLRESEERYRAVVEDQIELVSRLRADGTFLFVNDVYCRTFGKSADEIIGQRWVPVAHPDDVPAVEAELAKLSPEHPVVRVENRVFDGEGRVRWMEFVNRGFFNPSGELTEIQSVGRDVTERILAEEQLRHSEQRMRLAMEAAQVSTWDWDIAAGKVVWSDNLEAYLGMAPGTFDGTFDAFQALVHPDDRQQIAAALDEALQQRNAYQVEFRMIRPDGSVRWTATKGRAFYDPQGRPVRMLGVDVDITERKEAENSIRAALVERETLLKEVHHRVKNNLQVISSLLHLQSQHTTDQASEELFRESQHRVRSMALVHERLYRSQDFVRVDFKDYIESLANYLFRSYHVSADRISLEVDVHGVRLPIDAAVPCGLLVNELVSNCLKHAFQGRDRGRIRVELAPVSEAEALLCVSDDGVGLPLTMAPEAAETFGMQLILALMDQLHGKLEISRQAGTAMQVIFPLRTDPPRLG